MFFTNLCTPALIYLVFFLTHSLVATFQNKYKPFTNIIRYFNDIFITILCLIQNGYFLMDNCIFTFILYLYMTMIIYYVFGINPGY